MGLRTVEGVPLARAGALGLSADQPAVAATWSPTACSTAGRRPPRATTAAGRPVLDRVTADLALA